MGLSKFIKNKVHEKVVNYQAEKAHQREERLEERNEYEKGRKIGAFERGKTEGAGRLTESTKFASRGGSGRSRGTQRLTGSSGGFSGSMKNFDNIFGASTIGGGFGFGLGDEPHRTNKPPQRVTEFNPRTGKVRTIETIQPKHQETEETFGIGLEGLGGPPSKGKREKHPYDLF